MGAPGRFRVETVLRKLYIKCGQVIGVDDIIQYQFTKCTLLVKWLLNFFLFFCCDRVGMQFNGRLLASMLEARGPCQNLTAAESEIIYFIAEIKYPIRRKLGEKSLLCQFQGTQQPFLAHDTQTYIQSKCPDQSCHMPGLPALHGLKQKPPKLEARLHYIARYFSHMMLNPVSMNSVTIK